MDDWEFVESRFDDLSDQLETAKKHIVKVKIDFENRYRIWQYQIIPDRLMQLEKHLSLETAVRYYDLTFKDVHRLYRRAEKEFLEVADDVKVSQEKLKFHQELLRERENLLLIVHDGFVNDMRQLIEG